MTNTEHWTRVYETKDAQEVSWFQPKAEMSLKLIQGLNLAQDAAIVDMGGGASRLIDGLLDLGFHRPTVVDIAAAALEQSKARLGDRQSLVDWVCADARLWDAPRTYHLWHDRAAFHFLTQPTDQAAYIDRLRSALNDGGFALIASFAPDGPETCSGLPVQRYDAAQLGQVLGPQFTMLDHQSELHHTPWGSVQSFQYTLFQYRA